MATPRTIEKLFHFAFPCRDAEETRAFYEDLLGLPMTSCVKVAAVPSTGEAGPYLHIFFEMKDGSYLAFFDLGNGELPKPSPNTPGWVQHFAMEVPTMDDVKAMRDRLGRRRSAWRRRSPFHPVDLLLRSEWLAARGHRAHGTAGLRRNAEGAGAPGVARLAGVQAAKDDCAGACVTAVG